MKKKALITGITGQDGAYLSKLLLDKDYHVVGLTQNFELENFTGLNYLKIKDKVELIPTNLENFVELNKIIQDYKPSEVYNLASQSSVGVSYQKPLETITFNIISAVNLLESVRILGKNVKFFQASSAEIFGEADILPITETTSINPKNPYAISKTTVHQMVTFYRDVYKIFACSGILFNHESYLRDERFLIKKVIKQAINVKNGTQDFIKLGNLNVKRDFGYAPDYVKAMWLMLQAENPEDFVICSGKSILLKDIVIYILNKIGVEENKLQIDESLQRSNEVDNSYGSNLKIKTKLAWDYQKSFFDVVDILIEEEYKNL